MRKSTQRFLNDFEYVSRDFKQILGSTLNWQNPQTYNEKMQLYKISELMASYAKYADKYQVRDYVAKTIGSKYLIPIYGVYDSVQELLDDRENLPNQFILKATHGSGWNIICMDKADFNWQEASKKLNDWLQTSYYQDFGREIQYRDIQPRIICEKLLLEGDKVPADYKVLCFEDHVHSIRVYLDRFGDEKVGSFTPNWKQIPLNLYMPTPNEPIAKPNNLSEMLELSKKLAKPFPHVRVEFLYVDGQIFFSELTFTSQGGFRVFTPEKYNYEIGSLLKLPPVPKFKKRGVVYTCITGDYDQFYNHSFHHPEWDYVCFTDNKKLKSENNSLWEIRPLAFDELDKVRNQRWHKLHPHQLFPNHRLSLWVDGNVDIRSGKIFQDIGQAKKNKFKIATGPHPDRDCIYEEHKACAELLKDDFVTMREQIKLLIEDNYPKNWGLSETNILFRQHHHRVVKKVMADWWSWIKEHSFRDQLSFNYVLWKNSLSQNLLTENPYRFQIEDIIFYPHQKEKRKRFAEVSDQLYLQNQRILAMRDMINRLTNTIEMIKASKFYKSWEIVKSIKNLLKTIIRNPFKLLKIIHLSLTGGPVEVAKRVKNKALSIDRTQLINQNYQEWLKKNDISAKEIFEQSASQKMFSYRPLISILMPTYNTNENFLHEAIQSVLNQTYDNWQLCIADDNSSKPVVRQIIQQYAKKDSRIVYKFRRQNGHISRSSNTALKLCEGEYTGLFDHDDLLRPNALFEIVEILNKDRRIDVLYTDEDKVDEYGQRFDPHWKPDWSPVTLLSCNYVTHFLVAKTDLIKDVGGFRVGYEGSQDYDLILRLAQTTSIVVHIPKILYSWRVSPDSTASANTTVKPYAYSAGRRALNSYLDHIGIAGEIEALEADRGFYSLRLNGKTAQYSPQKNYLLTSAATKAIDPSPYFLLMDKLAIDVLILNPQELSLFDDWDKPYGGLLRENFQNSLISLDNTKLNMTTIKRSTAIYSASAFKRIDKGHMGGSSIQIRAASIGYRLDD